MTLPLHIRPVTQTSRASNRYCGPSAISILTGLDTADTARLLRLVSGRPAIKSTSSCEILTALRRLGIESNSIRSRYGSPRRITLVRWLKLSRLERGTSPVLLAAGCHWLVVQGRRYACGISKTIVPFSQIPHRCARVEEAYRLTRVAAPDPSTIIPPAPKPIKLHRECTAVKALAAKYGIEVDDSERTRSDQSATIWVYPPGGLFTEETDPLNDEHFAYDWEEARHKVQTYVDALAKLPIKDERTSDN